MEYASLNFKDTRLLIVGDVMLDQYWFGGTSRISPEAPVPIVHRDRNHDCPGGAANVALGVSALGAEPYLIGITGQDENAKRLAELLSKQSVGFHLEEIPHYPTITKLRVLSRNQQMIRLDTEKKFPTEIAKNFQSPFLKALDHVKVMILSDYGKGTLSDCAWMIHEAKTKKIKVLIDPKSEDFSIYRKADVITPNLKEFEKVVGPCNTLEILVEKARALLQKFEIGALVITRSEKGISVITKDDAKHISAVAREVHDVTGAGDTVIAVLGTALAAGMDLMQAAELGNLAAGIAVSKLGAATVTLQEIQKAFAAQQPLATGVMSESQLLSLLHFSKLRGETLVFTNGCFDILHVGHVSYLEEAKRLGDRLIVAVNDDASVKRLKGPKRPINCLADRMHVLAALSAVDWVVPFTEDTPERLIQNISPHFLVKGGDYKIIEDIPGAEFVLGQGGEVRLLSLKPGKSTTETIEAVWRHKDIAQHA